MLPSLGGTERKVADLHVSGAWKADALQIQPGSGAVWEGDGKTLLVSDEDDSGNRSMAIYAVPLNGVPRQRLTTPPPLAHDYEAAVSPDGRRLAFVRETSNSSGDMFVADIDGGHLHQITFDRKRIRGITWAPSGRTLIFSSNRSGVDELWQVADRGGRPELIPTKGNEVTTPSISNDGNILAYTSTTQNSNIWKLRIEPNSSPELFISSAGRNDSPQYSPDGNQVAFISDRSGAWEIWVSDNQGQQLRQLTNFGGPMLGTPHWSPDGRSLVFDARPHGHSAIYTISAMGGEPQSVIDDGFENKKPNWSRDGLSIYYTSNRNGLSQLWRSGLRGEHPVRLTTEPCNDSAESSDGRYIYFQNDSRGIYRIPVAGGKPELVEGLQGVYPSRYFDVADQIYFLNQENSPRLIQSYDPETHKIETIGSIGHQLVYGTPSLSIFPQIAAMSCLHNKTIPIARSWRYGSEKPIFSRARQPHLNVL